jgi:3-oxoacyl-[acyl-carrier-protein] synthase II
MARDRERIAITGLGAISALGNDAESTFSALCAGVRGAAPVTLFDTSGLSCQFAAEVKGLGETGAGSSRADRLALVAAREAVAAAALDLRTVQSGLAVGGTAGGLLETERELAAGPGLPEFSGARRLLSHPLSHTARVIREELGGIACSATVCSACSSGAVALALAAHWVASGRVQAALAGGVDALCRMTFAGFSALGVIDPGPCRPFDVGRAGLTLGEGAAFLVLESESSAARRGARVLAWLSGFAVGAEAHHVTHPEPSGERAAGLMLEALTRAGLSPEAVDYVNAHGTGTRANDAMEIAALGRVFGAELARVRVSSNKGQLGHTLGAAGALEAMVSVLSLDRARVPPTAGLETPEVAGVRHVLRVAEPAPLRSVVSNSFGFGGMSAVLVFEHPEAPARERPHFDSSLVISAAAVVGREAWVGQGCAEAALARPESGAVAGDPLSALDPSRSRRFDRASALATRAAELAHGAAAVEPSSCGLVAGSAYGNVERSLKFIDRLLARGLKSAAPADFPHLVPSATAGNAALYLRLKGPVFAVCEGATSGESALASGASLLEAGLASAMLVGAVDADDPVVTALAPRELAPKDVARSEGAGFVLLERAEALRARGRVPLARVTAHEQQHGGAAGFGTAWAAPADPETAVLVVCAADAALEALLAASPWAQVERCYLLEHTGFFEAAGAVGAAVAAAFIARGKSCVLMVSASADVRHVLRLESPEVE